LYGLISSHSVLAQQAYNVTVSGLGLEVKQTFKTLLPKDLNKLVENVMKIIIPREQLLPKIPISLGTISLAKLQQFLTSKKIDSTYYEVRCNKANSGNRNKYKFFGILDNTYKTSKFDVLGRKNHDLELVAKTQSRGTNTGDSNTRDCRYIIINPSANLLINREYHLTIAKKGYNDLYLDFEVIDTNNSVPFLKFFTSNVELNDKNDITLELIFEFNNSDENLKEKIISMILSKDSRLVLSRWKSKDELLEAINHFSRHPMIQGPPPRTSKTYIIKVSSD